jgi:hypothetical protein
MTSDVALSEVELQHGLERFTTQFSDRITQAMEALQRSSRPGVRDEALRKNLLYVGSATEIATGQFPVVNLLDMTVFIRLSRAVLENHWIPVLYGAEGSRLAEVFARSDQELSALAQEVLSVSQFAQLADLVDAWLADNPTQVRVEGIRLSDFARVAGTAAAARASQAKGLLSSVKGATHTANQALLLSERALFLVHRLPFLWRLQARLAAREILGDAVSLLVGGPDAPLAKVGRQVQRLTRNGAASAAVLGGAGLLLSRLRSRDRANGAKRQAAVRSSRD